MPKKNKTACKRRKYQRCRISRNRKNNNRRTRTIRRGGLPPDHPSDDNFDYESLIAGTYSDTELSALLTELANATAELKKYDYVLPPGDQKRQDEILQRYKSLRPEVLSTPEVRKSIVSTISGVNVVIAMCITKNNYNVVIFFEYLEKLRDIVEESEKIVQRLHELPDSNSTREYFNTELKKVRDVIKTTEETIQKLPYSESILKEFIAHRNWLRANIPGYEY